MKNIKFIALTALLTIGGLMGCNSKKETWDGTVTFWHTMGQANQALLDRMIAEFEEANPGIKVAAYSQGGYDDIAGKLRDAIPAGTTPSLSFCYPDNVASYLEAGAIEDLTSYVTNSEYGFTEEEGGVSDFIESYWNEGKNYPIKKGAVYSLPYAKSTEALFYNKTVFEEYGYEVPTTWAEMWTLCAKMKSDLGNKIAVPLGYDSDSNLFITKCEQENIDYTKAEGDDHFLFVNAKAKSMVSELKGYYDQGLFVTKGTQPNATYTSTMFTNAKILMSIGSTGGTTYNKSLNFEVGVAPIPRGTVNGHVVSQGPSICIFKRAHADEKIAAWKFYKHITNTLNSANFAISTGYEPVRTSSLESDMYKDHLSTAYNKDGTTRNLLAAAAVCTRDNYAANNLYFVSPVFNGSDTARDEVGGIIANVLLGTKSVDQAFTDALTNCLFVG